jgi:UDP-N-acetylglucosamine:LPS N-acetylglucosamine transferase
VKKVDLIYFNAGGGHRSTANALYQVIEKQHSLHPRLVNIYETGLLKVMDVFFRHGIDFYNFMLKRGWTVIDPLYLFLSQFNVRRNHSAGVRFLESYWREHQPDLVVSTVPLLNRMLWESLQKAKPGTPFVTLFIDFADCPPHYHYWIEPQKQFLLCPTERAVEQARSQGIPKERIFPISGVVINPRFYEPITVDRRIERQRLGLDPDLPTALVMFGGYGSTVMLEIAKCLERSPLNLQLIFICGRNEKLATTLRRSQSRLPRFVETFTSEIPYYMHLSDFFIGKPGPGSISEALTMKLPVITECNASTLVQERYNAEWLVKNEVGIVLRNLRNIDKAVAELIQPENLARYRANAASINNKAVFEVVDILDRIFEPLQLRT